MHYNTHTTYKKYAEIKKFQLPDHSCPYEKDNNRKFFKEKVKEISDLHKLVKVNIFNSMGNIIEEYLPKGQ